jgi:hypothetical protein
MHSLTKLTRDFVRGLLHGKFPGLPSGLFEELFLQVDLLFTGLYPGYQRSDSAYHDLHHTYGATEAAARLLDGHRKGGLPPALRMRDVELAIAAVMLHDSGYIKEDGDKEGTGAKYTLTHVDRSADYAGRILPALGVSADEVRVVQTAIHCTGVKVRLSQLTFRRPAEHYIGCVVGTADILSQMAALDYPERLAALYREYREAAAHERLRGAGIDNYQDLEDLMRRTRGFYENHVCRMLIKEWGKVYEEYRHHFADGSIPYLSAIDANLRRIDEKLADSRLESASDSPALRPNEWSTT